MSESGGILSRWQLRRQKVAEEDQLAQEQLEADLQASELANEPEATESDNSVAEANQSDEMVTSEELPDPEKIEVGGSFASFMADNVDPTAKAAALRALWKQPQYNEIDGLLEYALDYTNQPKLTAEHSAEIAKKIFRHVTKDKEDEAEQELAEQVSDESEANSEPNLDAKPDSDLSTNSELQQDNLDDTHSELSQNEPILTDSIEKPVG